LQRYWASSYKPEQYSFAHYALNAGYSIFYYDRLGTGHSSRISGFENLSAPQVELLARIAQAIRDTRYTADIKAEKVSLIGHSYGSFLSNAVLAKYPDLADTAALTGAGYPSPNDTAAHTSIWVPTMFAARVARTLPVASRPQFSETLDNGYLGFADMFSYIQSFLHQPNYETSAAQYSFSVSQALAISEFLEGFPTPVAKGFKGRVLVTSGQFDELLCNGDCESTYANGRQKDIFVDAKVSTYVQPNAGHGQNFESNAGDLYAKIVSIVEGKLEDA
jgi:pimeloyl-ACP methyl ester carboxylesterase